MNPTRRREPLAPPCFANDLWLVRRGRRHRGAAVDMANEVRCRWPTQSGLGGSPFSGRCPLTEISGRDLPST
jgi:hypothetical protein